MHQGWYLYINVNKKSHSDELLEEVNLLSTGQGYVFLDEDASGASIQVLQLSKRLLREVKHLSALCAVWRLLLTKHLTHVLLFLSCSIFLETLSAANEANYGKSPPRGGVKLTAGSACTVDEIKL